MTKTALETEAVESLHDAEEKNVVDEFKPCWSSTFSKEGITAMTKFITEKAAMCSIHQFSFIFWQKGTRLSTKMVAVRRESFFGRVFL